MPADRGLFVATVLLMIISAIFSYSLSSYAILYYDYNEFHFLFRQTAAIVLSIFTMWFIANMNPKNIRILNFLILIFFGILMSVMPILPDNIVTSAGGARRWVRLPGVSITPVEFFKIGFIFFLSWSFNRRITKPTTHENMFLSDEIKLFIPYALSFLFVILVIAVGQNDLGQVVLLGITLTTLALLAGGSFRLFSILILSSIVIAIIAIITSSHRIIRVKLWWANAQDSILSILPDTWAEYFKIEGLPQPYQTIQAFHAINNGGLFGTGLGNGIIKLGFLSEIHTDMILAGITEEVGIVGLFGTIMIFLYIIFKIFKIANRLENKELSLFCSGVGLLLSVSFIINAFGISGITPVKGIAVPLLSYGGSSMLANSMAIGMVISISKLIKPKN